MGSDRVTLYDLSDNPDISIHAPAWGATGDAEDALQRVVFQSTLPHGERLSANVAAVAVAGFQSTLPHGERPSQPTPSPGSIVFQSTLPHGERPERRRWIHATANFNPRSRMGSDCRAKQLPEYEDISIHAPAWGATGDTGLASVVRLHFNPRSRMGSDYRIIQVPNLGIISIHAPAWGATPRLRLLGRRHLISIHAPA